MENNTSLEKQNTKLILSVVIVVAMIIGGAILLRGSKPPTGKNTLQAVDNDMKINNTYSGTNIRPLSDQDHFLGNPDGRIVIVEYSDTECPFCKRFHMDMHKLVSNNSEVLWVYRHFPIASLHPKAFKESIATECANEQGGNDTFWQYTDELYNRTNSNNSLDPNELYAIASDIGLNTSEFKTCLDNEKYADIVEASVDDAGRNGARGTPSSFIMKDGQFVQMIPGALPYEQLSELVDSLIK